jgi:CIC family chloride channel protein
MVTASPGAYALVGMGALVAGTTHAPITAILILFELTNDYRIILPVMLAVVFSTLVARKLNRESIYTLKLRRRGIVLRYGRDVNVLAGVRVEEVMTTSYNALHESAQLPEILRTISQCSDDFFPVVDADGDFVGTVGLNDVRVLFSDQTLNELVIASDLAHTEIPRLDPGETVESALEKFGPQGLDAMPVVDSKQRNKLVGLLRRDAVTSFYNRKLLERIRE